MLSRITPYSIWLYFAFLLCVGMTIPAQSHAADSYYAPPNQLTTVMKVGYSAAFSEDYVNLNANPPVQFTSATAAFHYYPEKKSLNNLRVAIVAGSLSTNDKDFSWILISPSGLNINQFEEIVLYSTNAASFDKDGKAQFDGFLNMRGIPVAVKIDVKINFEQTSNFISASILGAKSSVGLTLSVDFKIADFGMRPVDSYNKPRGDIGNIRIDMQAIKQ